MVLDASASFTNFATEYARAHPSISETFEVTPALLDEFQAWLSPRNIRPGVGEWSKIREWISNRLKSEIFNQTLGVAKGDEVEAQRDPQIQAALKALGGG
jgi:carboxyl-terminal processing protease